MKDRVDSEYYLRYDVKKMEIFIDLSYLFFDKTIIQPLLDTLISTFKWRKQGRGCVMISLPISQILSLYSIFLYVLLPSSPSE